MTMSLKMWNEAIHVGEESGLFLARNRNLRTLQIVQLVEKAAMMFHQNQPAERNVGEKKDRSNLARR